MALELKRLQGKAMSFRANIEALGREYDGANEVTVEHTADVKGLRSQVTDMRDDLRATVDITKNSVAASNSGGEQQDEKPKTAAEPPKVSPPPMSAPPEVGQIAATTFQQDQK